MYWNDISQSFPYWAVRASSEKRSAATHWSIRYLEVRPPALVSSTYIFIKDLRRSFTENHEVWMNHYWLEDCFIRHIWKTKEQIFRKYTCGSLARKMEERETGWNIWSSVVKDTGLKKEKLKIMNKEKKEKLINRVHVRYN